MDFQIDVAENAEHYQLFQKEVKEEEEGAREDAEGWPISPPKEWGIGYWHGTRVGLHWLTSFHADAEKLDQKLLQEQLHEELRRLRIEGVSHPRLVEYFGVFLAPTQEEGKPDRLSLVFEAEGNGEPDREPLRERATRDPNLTQYETAVVMRDVASVFALAHARNASYRGRLTASDVVALSSCDKQGYCQVLNAKVPPWRLFDFMRSMVKDEGEDPIQGSDMRSLGLIGLECYLGRIASPEPQKFRSNMQYMDLSDELNAIIHKCLTAPLDELPTAAELVEKLAVVAEDKKDSEEYYFDCLYGDARNPQERIEQLEGQLKMAQENVDELEDEVRIQKEEFDDLDGSYDKSMQYQSSIVTERDELRRQMDEIKASRRRRDHPFSFLTEGPPLGRQSGSLFSDLFRSPSSNPFGGGGGDGGGGAGLFGGGGSDYSFSSSTWNPSSSESTRDKCTSRITTPGFDGDPNENLKRQELSVLLKRTMEDTLKDRQSGKSGPADLSQLPGGGNFFGGSMESMLTSFPRQPAAGVAKKSGFEQGAQTEDLGILTSGSKLAEDLLSSLPKA